MTATPMSDAEISPPGTVAVVLAGGLGTRLANTLPGIAKPMAPVCGRPFIEWVVRFLAASGLKQVRIATGFLGQTIEEHFGRVPIEGVDVRCVRETSQLGTGGALLNAGQTCGGKPATWLVCNGDSLILDSLRGLFATLVATHAEAAIFSRRVPDASAYGSLEVGLDGMLRAFSEKPSDCGAARPPGRASRAGLLTHA
ncbi:MAG: NTP transferase domain-containing protein [Deltaproteobacteria bacterium]|nr:NTP transferase domain-containing protein [Deltaproteobacteria bacterium]